MKNVGKMYMKPNQYLVPQPGSLFKSESEAIIKESPRQNSVDQMSINDYRDLHLGKRKLTTADEDIPHIFKDSESVNQIADENLYIGDKSPPDAQSHHSRAFVQKRNSATLGIVHLRDNKSLKLLIDESVAASNTVKFNERRNSELAAYTPSPLLLPNQQQQSPSGSILKTDRKITLASP